MAEITTNPEFQEACRDNRNKAKNYIQFRSALHPEDPKARFSGFSQGLKTFKAGQQVQNGAKPLPADLLMHESIPMVLSDGTKLYCDIFFPAGYESLEAIDDTRRIPALVAW